MNIEKNDRKGASRRRFIATAGAVSLALAAAPLVRGQGRKALKVSVGRQPWAAGNSPGSQATLRMTGWPARSSASTASRSGK